MAIQQEDEGEQPSRPNEAGRAAVMRVAASTAEGQPTMMRA
jgi:hypothetical protein